MVNAIQHFAVQKTRLGIPVWLHEEGLHGYASIDATNFPPGDCPWPAVGTQSCF